MLLTRRANTTGSLLQGMGVGSASCQERLCKTEFSAPKLRRTISCALVDHETSMRPREHDLLVSFATIFCQYTRGAAPVNFSSKLARVMQVFSEESNAPLNDWPRDLRPATVFHAAACFVRALDVDPECIVFAVVLLERLGIELLQVLLAPSTWRNVLISTLALATKVWYDESVHLHDVHERLLPYGYNTDRAPNPIDGAQERAQVP
ncbi:hypothetical protein AB1Y20_000274 [Prymnesium parvum]|uniref:Cyclin N-terminal domain-containing protein n=1 Tax=Prymnesium parvum TaxID=97485 RepID=A0AB34K4Y5_PRYPA